MWGETFWVDGRGETYSWGETTRMETTGFTNPLNFFSHYKRQIRCEENRNVNMDNNFTEIGKNEGLSSSDDEDKDLRLYGAMQDTVADVPKVRPGLEDILVSSLNSYHDIFSDDTRIAS